MILFNYIFRQISSTACAAVGIFVFTLITGNVLRDIVGLLAGGQLAVSFFFQLLALLIPYVVAYALPLGLLTAVLIVFGRLSSQREITAMRASGVSLVQIASPVVVLAALGVVLCLFINLDYAPRSRAIYRERLANAFTEDPFQFIHPRQFITQFPGYIIYADGNEGEDLLGLHIWEVNGQNEVTTALSAERGTFEYDPAGDSIILKLSHASGERRSKPDMSTLNESESLPTIIFQEGSLKLPLSGVLRKNAIKHKLSQLGIGELLEKRRALLIEEQAGSPTAFKSRIAIQMQIQRGLAMAFSALTLALIAIPLGIKVSRSETYANMAIALILAMGYYVSIVLITWFENSPHLRPDFLIWIPNIVLVMGAMILLRRTNRPV